MLVSLPFLLVQRVALLYARICQLHVMFSLFAFSESGAVKSSSTKTIFDALGLQPKVVDGEDEAEVSSEFY